MYIIKTAFGLAGPDSGNYALSGQPADIKASIAKRVVSIDGAKAADKTYDGTTATVITGAHLDNVISGDNLTLARAGTGDFANADAGADKSVSAHMGLSGSAADNYQLQEQPQNLMATISKRVVSVEGATAADKTYDGTTAATVGGAHLGNIIAGDNLTLTHSDSGTFTDADAGKNKAVSTEMAIGGSSVGNYKLAGQPKNLAATIGKRPVSVTGTTAAGKTYDGTTAAVINGAKLQNVVSGDNLTLTHADAGTFSNANAGADKAVSTKIGLSGAAVGNYQLSGQPKNLVATIARKSVSVAGATAADKTYDGTTADTISGAHLQGVLKGDNLTLGNANAGTFENANAGTAKPVATDFGIAGADAGNYQLIGQSQGLAATINRRSVSVSGATAADKTYDGTSAAVINGAQLKNVVSGDNLTLTNAGSGEFSNANAGANKAIATAMGIAGEDADNYALSGQPRNLSATINPKSVTASGVVAPNRTYDGTLNERLNTDGAALGGVVPGDDVALSGHQGHFSNADAGANKKVVAAFGLTGASAGNYRLTQPAGLHADIDPKTLSVSGVTADGKVYDGTATTYLSTKNAALDGVVGHDQVKIGDGSQAGSFGDPHAGKQKHVTSDLHLSGPDARNYRLSQPGDLHATIARRSLSASIFGNPAKVEDGNPVIDLRSGDFALGGFVGDQDAAVKPTQGRFAQSDTGTHISLAAFLTRPSFDAAPGTELSDYALPTEAEGFGTIRAGLSSGPPIVQTERQGRIAATNSASVNLNPEAAYNLHTDASKTVNINVGNRGKNAENRKGGGKGSDCIDHVRMSPLISPGC